MCLLILMDAILMNYLILEFLASILEGALDFLLTWINCLMIVKHNLSAFKLILLDLLSFSFVILHRSEPYLCFYYVFI